MPIAIGAQQLVEVEPPDRDRYRRQPLGSAAQKEIVAKARAGHQPAAGSLHRLKELEAMS